MKFFMVFLCLVAVKSASAISLPQSLYQELFKNELLLEEENRASANVNEYLDNALKGIRLWIVKKGMDPLPTEDIEKEFSAKVGLITWHGEFTLTHGWLQGLSTVIRAGNAVMNYEAQLLNLRLPIAFESVNVNYDYLAKIMGLGPKGGLEGKIKDLEIFVDITIDTKTMEIILQGFKITDAGKITVKFSGNPLVDWLTNVLTGLATTLLHEVAIKVVQTEVRELLENSINDINNGIHPNGMYLY